MLHYKVLHYKILHGATQASCRRGILRGSFCANVPLFLSVESDAVLASSYYTIRFKCYRLLPAFPVPLLPMGTSVEVEVLLLAMLTSIIINSF